MAFYSSDLKADGHGEVWIDFGPDAKLKQYGWRSTTKEDSYSNKTLLGNWNQERYDLCNLKERKPLPSQYAHYYETSYATDNAWTGDSAGRQGESPMFFQDINLNWVHHNTELFKNHVTQLIMAAHSLIHENV